MNQLEGKHIIPYLKNYPFCIHIFLKQLRFLSINLISLRELFNILYQYVPE